MKEQLFFFEGLSVYIIFHRRYQQMKAKATIALLVYLVLFLVGFINNVEEYKRTRGDLFGGGMEKNEEVHLRSTEVLLGRDEPYEKELGIGKMDEKEGDKSAAEDENVDLSSSILADQPAQEETAPKQTPRRLYSTTSGFLNLSMMAIETLLSTFRNLIIIGVCSNMLDAFLPFVTLCNSFLMMGFLKTDMYDVKTFYTNVFSAKLDFFNIVRLIVSPGASSDTLEQLAQYDFSSNILFNLAGEITLIVIFFSVFLAIKLSSIFCNSQKIRRIKTALRPVMNGLILALLPQLATFAGFHFRMLDGSMKVVNGFGAVIIFILFVVFFVFLLLQIRGIMSKLEYIEDTRFEIGLASRLDYDEDFQFDCLSFNMLYHPLLNYLRLLLFYLPIGAGYEIYYVSFGGAIISQLFIVMADISCPFFWNRRDKIFGPLNNFLLMGLELAIIAIGLAQSVGHPEVSILGEMALFGIASFLFPTALILMVFDARENCSRRCAKSSEVDDEQEESEVGKKTRGQTVSPLNKKIKKPEHSDDDDELDDYSANSLTGKKDNNKAQHVKIKKVKRGRMI